MRNFKKFLALVLAMLMVSACAVSISAFDDVAENYDYAEAIEKLAKLHEQGILTDEEFQRKKADILAKM